MLVGDLFRGGIKRRRGVLLAGVVCAGVLLAAAAARADTSQSTSASGATSAQSGTAKQSSKSKTKAPAAQPLVFPRGVPHSQRAEMWWALRFGVDQMHVRSVSSGASLEFRYRVLDADKAAVLADKNATPYLIDELTGTKLEVPVMEKIGALRQQTTAPQVGREYWMVFSNRAHLVKPGQRVDISVGAFHIRGLTVE